jgi:hypothetical protein
METEHVRPEVGHNCRAGNECLRIGSMATFFTVIGHVTTSLQFRWSRGSSLILHTRIFEFTFALGHQSVMTVKHHNKQTRYLIIGHNGVAGCKHNMIRRRKIVYSY